MAVIQLTDKHFKHRHPVDLKVSRLHKNVRLITTHTSKLSYSRLSDRGDDAERCEQKKKNGRGELGTSRHAPLSERLEQAILLTSVPRLTSIKIWCLGKKKVAVVRCCGLIGLSLT